MLLHGWLVYCDMAKWCCTQTSNQFLINNGGCPSKRNTQATKALIKNTVTSIEHPNIVLPSKRLVPTPPAYPPPWHVWAAAHWCDDADPWSFYASLPPHNNVAFELKRARMHLLEISWNADPQKVYEHIMGATDR